MEDNLDPDIESDCLSSSSSLKEIVCQWRQQMLRNSLGHSPFLVSRHLSQYRKRLISKMASRCSLTW
ncbi:hypothetical protein QQP08_011194 [Theobroma cacao]|uniref:Uncharacterized protein n=1 Tax=Theobroma cacao TaxID=3641 RepID=A0A061FTV5_THECC|nr:Uncharacterized protein TCM_012201 [Theobroma cacao]WRX18707.1 hypothetical protein QQP08_011194 [Theobroma cacao]